MVRHVFTLGCLLVGAVISVGTGSPTTGTALTPVPQELAEGAVNAGVGACTTTSCSTPLRVQTGAPVAPSPGRPSSTPTAKPGPSPTSSPTSSPTPTPTPKPGPTPTPTSVPTATPTPSPSGVKPEISGLLDRNGAPAVSLAPYMGGWVVNVTWAELQPDSGATIAPDNPIDQAIALIHSNPAYAKMHLRVRIMAGIDSPSWVEAMSGGPAYVYNDQSGVGGDVPRFWTAPVEQAYANLQALLAARYDNDPEIEDVTVSGCMTVYAEPLIREIEDPTTVADLLAAGYTETADQTCQEDAIADQQVWVHTHSSIALNPYQTISAGGSAGVDESFTQSLMAYCRSTLGERCTLGNNSIRTASLGTQYAEMYSAMQASGPSLYFQTAQASLVGDLQTTVLWAVGVGANDVELPSGYATLLTPAQMEADNQALCANAQ